MGKRGWLDRALDETYIPAIAGLSDTKKGQREVRRLAQELRDWWVERGFTTLKQQQSLMDTTRRAIRERLGDAHFSLVFIDFSRDEYFELNRGKQQMARDRQLHQQYLQQPEAIVARAVDLLKSPEWAEVAAGLAVLTGRRLNEVLRTAQFEIKSQWVVTFRGALKRRGEAVPLVFDIPCLTTAKRVVEATARLREMTPNGVGESKVAQVSDRVFADLVPLPFGKGNLYSHLWRSVYCCVATFWYCPHHVDELLFKAHIMGHFESLSAQEVASGRLLGGRLESFSSERHYRLYEIDDAVIAQYQGKRKGVKLGVAGIHPLEVFAVGMPENQPEPLERKHPSGLRIWKEDHPRILEVLERFGGKTQADRVNAWLLWSEQMLEALPSPLDYGQKGEEGQAIASSPTAIASSGVEEQGEQGEKEERLEDGVKEVEDGLRLGEGVGNNSSLELCSLAPLPSVQPSLEGQIAELIGVMRQFVAVQVESIASHPAPRASASGERQQGKRQRSNNSDTQDNEALDQERGAPGRKRGDDDALVDRAIDAIVAFNDQPGRLHDDKWFLTANLLKKFTPKNNQRAAERCLLHRAQEIQEHHRRHQLQPDHNNRHKRHNILDVIDV